MKHKRYKCPPDCDNAYCNFCQGGLFFCPVCGAAEGAITQECPGVMTDSETWNKVYNGELDYVDGKWIPGNGEMPYHAFKIQIEE